jgi:Fic family protein
MRAGHRASTVESVDAPLLSTHPFITFDFDMRTINAQTWLKLGEAMSKCQHLGGAPVKPGVAVELSAIYLARGVQATTAIEGNTLSAQEVLDVVQKGSAGVPQSQAYLEREVSNIATAIVEIDEALRRGERLPLTRERLCVLNFKVLDGIPDEPHVVPGVLRKHDVTVGAAYRPPHYTEMPELVDRFVKWLADVRRVPHDAPDESRFTTSLISAILAHLYIAWIHPFGNGNGRVARLVEVQILSESGIVPLIATNLLSDFYNKTRGAYYLALAEAQRDPGAFVRYAIAGFLDEVRLQIERVRSENLAVHWESYVYELFNDRPNTDARARQRAVALCMPVGEWLRPEAVTNLNPPIARAYAICGERTPARDLNDLAKMGLVERRGRRLYRVRREIIEGFVPPVLAD